VGDPARAASSLVYYLPNLSTKVEPSASEKVRSRPLLKLALRSQKNLGMVTRNSPPPKILDLKGRHVGERERGVLGTPGLLDVVWLRFELFPVWLLALDSNFISSVSVLGFPSLPALSKQHLWDRQCTLVYPHVMPALEILRTLLVRVTATAMWREFHAYLEVTRDVDWRSALAKAKAKAERGRFPSSGKYMRGDRDERSSTTQFTQDDLAQDVIAGVDAIGRYTDSTWWEWKRGSTLFFWRRPAGEQRTAARDGTHIFIQSRLPRYQRSARVPGPLVKHLILEKLKKILHRGYVIAPDARDFIRSLIDSFEVAKDSDTRLVYNGTSCGLNDALWTPNFWLPTPATAARSLGYGYNMVDIDLGGMYLNFPLHKILQI
jgi:hypothetical protein